MDVLFIHNNFPGQFVHMAQAFAQRPGARVFAVGSPTARPRPGVTLARYALPKDPPKPGHPLVERFTSDVVRGELAGAAMQRLSQEAGCDPALIVGHSGWGETLFARDIFPEAKQVVYSEFFYNYRNSDVGFDPEFPDGGLRTAARIRTKNAGMLTALAAADMGLSPTEWQKRQHPDFLWDRIQVAHDGVDVDAAAPNPDAQLRPAGVDRTFTAKDEVITFVNRQLEPYRGYHVFMRALPEIMAKRPNAQVLIVGGDGVAYGRPAPAGTTWKDTYLDEVRGRIDMSRVHFLGQIPKPDFLALLQISSCHVYLTYPFVLSWSLLEAMAAGCLIVGSDTAPVREAIVDGVNGRLVDFFDVVALAETVARTLAERDTLGAMRRAARQTALATYDLRVCLTRQMALLDGVMGAEPALQAAGPALVPVT
ncbi:glycosyltransferase [Methylopila sp. 73B]|uniref:glycosyltransferase n=1 Tax=Methylopila sp. 73B TaxID=1120792 RepID=UPI00037208F1|nr:glycosyltransferase [Methylopila sp. 73B]